MASICANYHLCKNLFRLTWENAGGGGEGNPLYRPLHRYVPPQKGCFCAVLVEEWV